MDPAKYARDYNSALKFSAAEDHKSFQEAIKGGDLTARKVYADYLDETGEGHPGASEILRHHEGPLEVVHEPGEKVRVNFTKRVSPGTKNKQRVWVNIRYNEGRLSLSGDHRGHGMGQIVDSVKPAGMTLTKGWTHGTASRLHSVWNRWHLNDMRAGTPAQEEFLRSNPQINKGYFAGVLDELEKAGLNPDPTTGDLYGHKWHHEEVPVDVLKFLAQLPEHPPKKS